MAKVRKTKPYYDSKKDCYRLKFCYHGKPYRDNQLIKNMHSAYQMQYEVNLLLARIQDSIVKVPEGKSIDEFIFGKVWGEQETQQEEPQQDLPMSLMEWIDEYTTLLHYRTV